MGVYRDAMDHEMARRGYATKTRKCYVGCIKRFLRFTRRSPDKIEENDFRRYLAHLADDCAVSRSTFNQNVAAVKLLFCDILRCGWDIRLFEYQTPEYRLPVVLSTEEVQRLFSVISNPRDRSLLEMAYSAGLRLGEILRLKVPDIDSRRMVIRVEQGKGRKDRYVMLSKVLLKTLREYWRACKPHHWLFPGRDQNKALDPTAAQRMISLARKRARINKRASFHTLRHSFATHLMESGTNIRVIQALLGHRRLYTTEHYTHLAGNYLKQTISPLDALLEKTHKS